MTIIEVPDELIGSLNKGRLVLFVGHDLDISESGLPSMADFASELAQKTKAWQDCPICRDAGKCMRPGECILPFRQIATIYEQENRVSELISFLQDRLTENIPMTPTLQAITRLPVNTIVTTTYDERLERAYQAAGIPYQITAMDSQVVADESKRVQILHLYGVLSQPESLVLTEADHAALAESKPLIAIMLQSYLVTRACLFAGVDFNDPYLQTLYSRTVRELGDLRRWPYILESYPSPFA